MGRLRLLLDMSNDGGRDECGALGKDGEMSPRSGVESSLEGHWIRGSSQTRKKTSLTGALLRLCYQLALGPWASHTISLGLSFHFCKTVGLDAAYLAAMTQGLCYHGLVPRTARSTREIAKVAGSGRHVAASWHGSKQNGNVKAKSKQMPPGSPVWPGR